MAGLLSHLGLGAVGFLIIYLSFYKSKRITKIVYGGVFIMGNILPDLVDFGFLSIKMGSLNPDKIMGNPLFHNLALLGHTFSNWIILALIVIAIAGVFYGLGKISRQAFIGVIVCAVLVLIGILLHLRFDVLIQERSHWI